MAWCGEHFTSLYDVIRKKGMGAMCATERQEIGRRMQSWLHGTMRQHEFDPMVGCLFEIRAKADQLVAEVPVLHAPDCPLCVARMILGPKAPSSWIDNCTDLMVVLCETNGLRRH